MIVNILQLQAAVGMPVFNALRALFGAQLTPRIGDIGPIVDRLLATRSGAEVQAILTQLCQAPNQLSIAELVTLMARLLPVAGGGLTPLQIHQLVIGLRTGAAGTPLLRPTDIYNLFRVGLIPVPTVANIADSAECLEGLRYVLRSGAGNFTVAEAQQILLRDTLNFRTKGKLFRAVQRPGAPVRAHAWTYTRVRTFLNALRDNIAPALTGPGWELCIDRLIQFDARQARPMVPLAAGGGGGVLATVNRNLPATPAGAPIMPIAIDVRQNRVNHFRNEHTNAYYNFDFAKAFLVANHYNNFWNDGVAAATIQADAVTALGTAPVLTMLTAMRAAGTAFQTCNAQAGGILYSVGINVYDWAAAAVRGEISQFYPDQLQYRVQEALLHAMEPLM